MSYFSFVNKASHHNTSSQKKTCCERVMDLKYYSLDHVSVLSVPSVVQSSGPFVFVLWRPG